MKNIITYGTYDMLHKGHINILRRAKERGDYLIVGVTSEDYDRSRGKLNVFESEEARVNAIKALDFVDEVILETHKNQKQEDMVKYKIDEFVIGDDWVGKFDYLNQWTKVVYLARTEGISSTKLRNEKVKELKIGLVGANSDSERFIREMADLLAFKVESVYDPLEKKLEEFHSRYLFATPYKKIDDFLASSIDCVYIASNIDEHYEQIKQSLQANKHVLCENPLVLKEDQSKEVFDIAEKKGLILLLAIKTAFAPAYRKMIEFVHSGIIGEVQEVRSTFTSLYKERGFPEEYIEHGATNLLLSYPALIAQHILGDFRKIDFFDQTNEGYDTSNRAITIHNNGKIAISTVGVEMKSEGDAIISGTKGYIHIPAPWWLTKTFEVSFEDTNKNLHFEYEFKGDGLRYMIAEFVALIRRNQTQSKRLSNEDMLEINRYISEYNKKDNK